MDADRLVTVPVCHGEPLLVGGQMAKQVHTSLVDDIDGGPAAETIAFSFQGRDYQIDLSEVNAARFRSMMSEYAEHARKTSVRRTPSRSRRSTESRRRAAAIREWARASGMEDIGSRGRIPQQVIDRYEAAHADS
jgi:hypothetical protein